MQRKGKLLKYPKNENQKTKQEQDQNDNWYCKLCQEDVKERSNRHNVRYGNMNFAQEPKEKQKLQFR